MKIRRDRIKKSVPQVCKKGTARAYSNPHIRTRKYLSTAFKRRMRANQLLPAVPYMKVELVFCKPKEVTTIHYFESGKTSYAVCPSCGYSLEREYQKHCEQCGQLLGWGRYARKKVNVVRIAPRYKTG